MCCELDLLVPPLGGTVVAGDQPHPVQTAEVAVDKRVARAFVSSGAPWVKANAKARHGSGRDF
jgi:hypothetical protein